MDPVVSMLVTSVVASVIWGLRLEGRVNAIQQKIADKEETYLSKMAGIKELISSKFDSVDSRLERIERSLNGSLHGDRHG